MTWLGTTVAFAAGLLMMAASPAAADSQLTARTMDGYALPPAVRINLTNQDDPAKSVRDAVVGALGQRGIKVDDTSKVTLEVTVYWDTPSTRKEKRAEVSTADTFDRSGQGDLDDMNLMPYADNTRNIHFRKHDHLGPGPHVGVSLTLYGAGKAPVSAVSNVATRDAGGAVEQASALGVAAVRALGTNQGGDDTGGAGNTE
jgi:hypothetical protein